MFKNLFKEIRYDFPASIVVFVVAVPLCLGIALASGAPLFAGVIAGIIGGIVVGAASGSPLGVSGPAAGLAVIVLNGIETLGTFEVFLLATIIAGVIQVVMGYLKLGIIAHYFPTSVIKGMLTGIGVIIILKQIPHAIGYDVDFEGDMAFQVGQETTFSILMRSIDAINEGALLLSLVSMGLLILWQTSFFKKHNVFKLIQGPLVVVVLGIIVSQIYKMGVLPFTFSEDEMVSLPVAKNIGEFFSQFYFPDFSRIFDYNVYFTGLVIAVIASLETLLSVEATDKLDPYKRVTPTARELQAQGLGNIVSGFLGGLPLTQVIVRSSANITFGGRTKASAIIHGFLILISVIFIPGILNMIPLSSLACILLVVGYNLAKPQLFKAMYKLGWEQFVPFAATVIAIVLTDLLKGIGIGLAFAIFYLLRSHYRNSYHMRKEQKNGKDVYIMDLAEEVSFLNKGSVMQALNSLPNSSEVIVDASGSKAVDYDIIEVIRNFKINSQTRGIQLTVVNLPQVNDQSTVLGH
jgi:MFS superfamily sulfate permease-like transporter